MKCKSVTLLRTVLKKNLNVGYNLTKKKKVISSVKCKTTGMNIQQGKFASSSTFLYPLLTPACFTKQDMHTLQGLIAAASGGEGRAEGAALSHDTINDCDPGPSKNKDCFSIPPLLPGE